MRKIKNYKAFRKKCLFSTSLILFIRILRRYYYERKNKVEEERKNVLVVYYGEEKRRKIKAFFEFIRNEGFECRMMGPINSPDCPWVFVYLDKKEFIVGKPGVEFASERYIEHAVLINDFKDIYEIYKNTHTLNDKQVYELIKKYENNSIFCFDINIEPK